MKFAKTTITLLSAVMVVSSQAATTILDVGNFGAGGFVDGGIAPAAQNATTTGDLTVSATITYTGQWGSESGTAASDLNDNHVFDGEAGYTAHTGASVLTIVFSGLTTGLEYNIAATWRGQANAATNTPYSVGGFSGGLQNTTRNQEIASIGDYAEGGFNYETLFSGTTTGTTLTLTLSNNADQFVVADSFLLESVPEPSSTALLGLGGLALLLRRRR